MKPFIVLMLCCSFISSRANPVPFEFSHCDDPDVFKAVDAALKKYNGDRATGNQFALYMVMEAKRTAGPDPQFYVKYRIKETTCAAEENKLWQDCDYKASEEASTGECTARVHMSNGEKMSNVSQDCKIFPATKIRIAVGTCLGCFQPISSDSSEVPEILKQAIQKFNRHSDEPALFKLVEIKEAKRQMLLGIPLGFSLKHQQEKIYARFCAKSASLHRCLLYSLTSQTTAGIYGFAMQYDPYVVAGWNYIIKFEIEETNCSKDQFQDLTPECKTTSRGRVGQCEAKAFVNLQAQIADIASKCKFPVEETAIPATRTGCSKTIPNDHPELKELLKVSMQKYNLESNDDFYYKAGEIEAATVQLVAGRNYHLTFSVWKTNCSKTEFEEFNEYCEATSESVRMPCEAQIHVIPGENKILPQINCTKERSMSVLLRRPPGFTPFRSTAALELPNEILCTDKNEEERQSPGEDMRRGGGQEPAGEGELEHKHGHKHGHKHRHGRKKEQESGKRHRDELACGHRNGHGCGHKKHSKMGNKHPNSRSSEESSERGFNQNEILSSVSAGTAAGLVNPGGARKETSTHAEPLILPDTSLFNGLPDRTESTSPRCPGKPWKQNTDLPAPPSFPREFTDEDLLPPAVENTDPATEDSTPPENKDFDLLDALV